MKRKVKRRAADAAGDSPALDAEVREADLGKLMSGLAAKLHFDSPIGGLEDLDPALLEKAKGEAPELRSVLKQLQQRLEGLQGPITGVIDRFAGLGAAPAKWGSGSESVATYVEVKVQMLLGYIIGLAYYLLLKTRGVPVRDHPVVPRLLWIRTVLEKLRPLDQRLQYQITKLLQWADARKNGTAPEVGSAQDPLALRPGALAAGVEDEAGEEGEEVLAPAKAAMDDDGLYRPPKIAQAEFTGDHFSLKERAERDLERKRERLERSEFVRSLREEFTDAPTEVHQEIRSARAERAARKMAEQQAYEEDNLVRLRGSKKQLREQRQLLRDRRAAPAGAISLDDAVADIHSFGGSLSADDGPRPGRKGRRGGGVLQEYRDATERARQSRRIVDSALGGGDLGDLGPAKRKGGGKGSRGGAKRQKR